MKPAVGKTSSVKKSKERIQNSTFKGKLRDTTGKVAGLKDPKLLINIVSQKIQRSSPSSLAKSVIAKSRKNVKKRTPNERRDIITSTPHYTKLGKFDFFNSSGSLVCSPINQEIRNADLQLNNCPIVNEGNINANGICTRSRKKSLLAEEQDKRNSSVICVEYSSKVGHDESNISIQRSRGKRRNDSSGKILQGSTPDKPLSGDHSSKKSKIPLRTRSHEERSTTKQSPQLVADFETNAEREDILSPIVERKLRNNNSLKNSTGRTRRPFKESSHENQMNIQSNSISKKNQTSPKEHLCTTKGIVTSEESPNILEKGKITVQRNDDFNEDFCANDDDTLTPENTLTEQCENKLDNSNNLVVNLFPMDFENRTEFVNKTPRRGKNVTSVANQVAEKEKENTKFTHSIGLSPITVNGVLGKSSSVATIHSSRSSLGDSDKSSRLHSLIDEMKSKKANVEGTNAIRKQKPTREGSPKKLLSKTVGCLVDDRNVRAVRLQSFEKMLKNIESRGQREQKRLAEGEAEELADDEDFNSRPGAIDNTVPVFHTVHRCFRRKNLPTCTLESERHQSFVHNIPCAQRAQLLHRFIEKIKRRTLQQSRKIVHKEIQTSLSESSAVTTRAPSFRRSAIRAGLKYRNSVTVIGYDESDSNFSDPPNIYESLRELNPVEELQFSNPAEPSLSFIEKPWRFENEKVSKDNSPNLSLNVIHMIRKYPSLGRPRSNSYQASRIVRCRSTSTSDESEMDSPTSTLARKTQWPTVSHDKHPKLGLKQYTKKNINKTLIDSGVIPFTTDLQQIDEPPGQPTIEHSDLVLNARNIQQEQNNIIQQPAQINEISTSAQQEISPNISTRSRVLENIQSPDALTLQELDYFPENHVQCKSVSKDKVSEIRNSHEPISSPTQLQTAFSEQVQSTSDTRVSQDCSDKVANGQRKNTSIIETPQHKNKNILNEENESAVANKHGRKLNGSKQKNVHVVDEQLDDNPVTDKQNKKRTVGRKKGSRPRNDSNQENLPETNIQLTDKQHSRKRTFVTHVDTSNILETADGRRPQRNRKKPRYHTDLDLEALGLIPLEPRSRMKQSKNKKLSKIKGKTSESRKDTLSEDNSQAHKDKLLEGNSGLFESRLGMSENESTDRVRVGISTLPPIDENQETDGRISRALAETTNFQPMDQPGFSDSELMPPPTCHTSDWLRGRMEPADSGFEGTRVDMTGKTTGKKRTRSCKTKKTRSKSGISAMPAPSDEDVNDQNVNSEMHSGGLRDETNMSGIQPLCTEVMFDNSLDASKVTSIDNDFISWTVGDEVVNLRFVGRIPSENDYQKVGNLYVVEAIKDPEDRFCAGYLRLRSGDHKRLTKGNKYSFMYSVVSGAAHIRLEDKTSLIREGSFFYVPKGAKYAITNANRNSDLLLHYMRSRLPTNENNNC